MRSITSRIYGGAKANYWIYANTGIDTVRGAPLMVWQDGPAYVGARDLINYRLQTVTDNLVHQKANSANGTSVDGARHRGRDASVPLSWRDPRQCNAQPAIR